MSHLVKTFDDFLNLVDDTYNKHSFELRYGQTIMNVLYSISPDKYKELTGTQLDCFYDDGLVRFTLDELKRTWTAQQ